VLNVDHIRRSNDQSEQSQPDTDRRSESSVDSVHELLRAGAGHRQLPR
jgi:hypothetical protein